MQATTQTITAQVVKLPRPGKAKARKAPQSTRQLRRQVIAGSGIGVVALTLVGLSLTHLAHGIALVTNAPAVEAWALAIGLDVGFVALELAGIAAASDRMTAAVARFARPAIVGTLTASALFNATAFASQAAGMLVYLAAALGVAVPALVFCLTKIAVALFLDRR